MTTKTELKKAIAKYNALVEDANHKRHCMRVSQLMVTEVTLKHMRKKIHRMEREVYGRTATKAVRGL